ncbi:hypothetical protein GGP41_000393 [Bipolaris sorokiniana]|uniref:C2H2-type domain-containing protein n=1 Tax=Cochliobolus sativus TaxID=45130 RepID=A0A8H5Z719_COCSA|nr:hypothetical protein GGP41_000393 [Bipolaris sorokiniana]
MNDSLPPAAEAPLASRSDVKVVLASEVDPWLTEILTRANCLEGPLENVRQQTSCLNKTLSCHNVTWQLCSIMLPDTPDSVLRKGSNPFAEAFLNYRTIHIQAFVAHVIYPQKEIVFKLTPKTIEELIEYHKKVSSVNLSVDIKEWLGKKQKVEKLQQRFVQVIKHYIFRTDIKALEDLEEEGAGELFEGRSEEVKSAIMRMLFHRKSNQASGLPWSDDSHTAKPDSDVNDLMAFRHNSGSLNQGPSFPNSDHNTSVHQSMGGTMESKDPLALEITPYGSPLPTSSTISHLDSVLSPPYTSISTYNNPKPTFHHIQNDFTHHTAISNDYESLWISLHPEAISWDLQSYVLPNSSSRPKVSEFTSYVQYRMPQQGSLNPVVDSGAFNRVAFNNNIDESDDLSGDSSDSDSDASCYNELSSSKGSEIWPSRRAQVKPNVFRPEGWSTKGCIIHTTTGRLYLCQELIGPNKDMPCPGKYKRSEHLRRHMRTSHFIGLRYEYVCQVPPCFRGFRRSDNLRSHYLTHLKPAKKAKNKMNKMVTFQDLKKILSSEEKDLLKSLKAKLGQT